MSSSQQEVHGLVTPARPSQVYICQLALQFDCLRFKKQWFIPEKFDAEKLAKDSEPWSTGEKHCVNFVLAVWSGHDWEGREFRLIDAMGSLGRGNVEPIIDWMANPRWP